MTRPSNRRRIYTPEFYRSRDDRWYANNMSRARIYTLKLIYRATISKGRDIFTYDDIFTLYYGMKHRNIKWSTIDREIRRLAYDYILLDPIDENGNYIPPEEFRRRRGRFRINQNFRVVAERLNLHRTM